MIKLFTRNHIKYSLGREFDNEQIAIAVHEAALDLAGGARHLDGYPPLAAVRQEEDHRGRVRVGRRSGRRSGGLRGLGRRLGVRRLVAVVVTAAAIRRE